MKVRSGFVSNSSSSSFIVRHRGIEDEELLTEEEREKLEDFGFKRSNAYYPETRENEELSTEEYFYSYVKTVICNEDEVLDWLIDNDFSFLADCHYEHYSVSYDKEEKII